MFAEVDCVSPRGHAWLIGVDGMSYLALSSNVAEDSVGRRYLVPSEEVDFEPMENKRNPAKPLAINVKPAHREIVSLDSHQELCTLVSWNGHVGAASRPHSTHDQLWCEAHNIVTDGAETLRVGSKIYCKVARPFKAGQRWRAVEIEVCIEEVAADAQQNTTA